MSSKRGRKRNDSLPPNRARDVQRAFRARRAAHLEALETRVAELEEENAQFRVLLNLPPANRPSLGKGPTGKDKPRLHTPPSTTSATAAITALAATAHPARSKSVTPFSPSQMSPEDPHSPLEARMLSASPGIDMDTALRPSPDAHQLDTPSASSWDQPDLAGAPAHSPPSAGYPLTSVVAHRADSDYGYPSASPIPTQRPLSAASSTMYTIVSPGPSTHAIVERGSYMDSHSYPYRENPQLYTFSHPFQADPYNSTSDALLQREDSPYGRRPMTADAHLYNGTFSRPLYAHPPPHSATMARFSRLTPRPPDAVPQPPFGGT